jgi:uncharacterized membrane protein
MLPEPRALAAILGMALVTYATRTGGVWLLGRTRPSRLLTAWLNQLLGAILVALVAPAVLAAGLAGFFAGACAALIAARTRNVALALIVGIVALQVVRQIG